MNTTSPEGQRIAAQLRNRFVEVWTDIRRELGKHRQQQYADLVQGVGDPEDAAAADVVVDLNLAEIDRDAQELKAIQDALARLNRGDFGYCQRCGEEIAPGRLEAMPHATLCVKCQEHIERHMAADPTPSL